MLQDYNLTLNLPGTEFPMRGNLPKREPEMLSIWDKDDIYKQLMKKNQGKPLYVLHDGPPYANGNIHMGTAMNKILKDIIVRYKNMSGYHAPYIPGWDTHGLPIELTALKKDGVNPAVISKIELRQLCKEFAQSFIESMSDQFKRLGVIGDFDHAYQTLKPEYEAKQIEIFSKMAKKGFIYKGLKPVYWCAECHTALAEAEIEYENDSCSSIYVNFKVVEDCGKFSKFNIPVEKISFVIWTTTTWTLPGNVAICLGESYEYAIVESQQQYFVIAKKLVDVTMQAANIVEYHIVGCLFGKELEGMKTAHPFLNRTSLIICGDHVTLDSGTGCVHTAPGHGVEDFEVCKRYPELPIIVPVDSNGMLTEEAGMFCNYSTKNVHEEIETYLKKTGHLFALKEIIHQYPHCWRCHHPILFRATEQWFCSIDGFKQQALEAIRNVQWIPEWGENRIESMVQDRSDWCISRQRAWGVPIPILYCGDCGQSIINDETAAVIGEMVRQEGADAWYRYDPKDFLPTSFSCPYCHETNNFKKETDIMDVWFDSGVSHAAVLEQGFNLRWPADLYLEGADQYRGWFQSSLLTAVATKGCAPYKTVCTHGWVVDGQGKKMSKSLGNGMEANQILKEYGADILRLWVASSDYHGDVRISKEILKQLSDAYRKLRNTAKYMLGNLYDFNPDCDMIPLAQLSSLDQFALFKLNAMIEKSQKGYQSLEFHTVYHAIYHFCVVDMSNFYLDIIKDCLYCEKPDSLLRRSAQTVIYLILDSLTKLIAPILAFTSNEIWLAMPHKKSDHKTHVLFGEIPQSFSLGVDTSFVSKWDILTSIHADVQKAMEIKRSEKIIGKSLDAKVVLFCQDSFQQKLFDMIEQLKTILICSQVEIKGTDEETGEFQGDMKDISISILPAEGKKCERCWTFSKSVGMHEKHLTLCTRCTTVLG